MINALELGLTREQIKELSLTLLEDLHDQITAMIAAVEKLPENRVEAAELALQIEATGNACWKLLETYSSTLECEGNA